MTPDLRSRGPGRPYAPARSPPRPAPPSGTVSDGVGDRPRGEGRAPAPAGGRPDREPSYRVSESAQTSAARPASSRATGMRNGEQDT